MSKHQTIHRPQGTIFQISKDQTPFPIQQGDVITLAYDSSKRGAIPVDPVIVRKRDDLHWGDSKVKQIAPASMLFFSCLMFLYTYPFKVDIGMTFIIITIFSLNWHMRTTLNHLWLTIGITSQELLSLEE